MSWFEDLPPTEREVIIRALGSYRGICEAAAFHAANEFDVPRHDRAKQHHEIAGQLLDQLARGT